MLFFEEFFQRTTTLNGFFATNATKRLGTFGSHFNRAGFFEQGKVVGHGRLGQSKPFDQLAHIKFAALLEFFKYPLPDRMPDRLKKRRKTKFRHT